MSRKLTTTTDPCIPINEPQRLRERGTPSEPSIRPH